jgi:hypothetical protein
LLDASDYIGAQFINTPRRVDQTLGGVVVAVDAFFLVKTGRRDRLEMPSK